MKHNYNKLSVMALLLLAAPFCHAQDDASSPSQPTANAWVKLSKDARQALNDITTIQGWKEPLEIMHEHGFTVTGAQALLDRCKVQALILGSASAYLGYRLQKAALIPVGIFASLYCLRLGLDRYC